jgi:hypothetical protein
MKKGIFENGQEDTEVSAALGGLEKVTAPASFEANVRSAIEARSQRSFFNTPGFLLGLKFAVPAIILLFLGAFLLFSTGGVDNDRMAVWEPVAQPAETDVASGVPASGPPSAGQVNNVVAEGGQVNARIPVNRTARGSQTSGNGREFQGGSRDFALSQDNTSIRPRDVEPDQKLVTGPVTAETILSKMGISSKCIEKGCNAVSVRSASIGGTSGVKEGDVIEAIDGKPVNAGVVFEGNVVIRNITVRRDGKRFIVPLSVD